MLLMQLTFGLSIITIPVIGLIPDLETTWRLTGLTYADQAGFDRPNGGISTAIMDYLHVAG